MHVELSADDLVPGLGVAGNYDLFEINKWSLVDHICDIGLVFFKVLINTR